ncbi:HPr kinase/phosphorylase [Reyranella sp.]|uniref:HPr kinase/phosphorylase n=1 Tax=Reyranella sp. TaxID=1929291 RepID=UPI002730C4F6|nr:aldolase [Reyranella sp.]MDP2372659.1 aldolase [Reyranella sp.]
MLAHATCVALRLRGRAWRGVLLRGPSGAGKSDLALRLIEADGRLVADDQTRITRNGRTLLAAAPAALAGLIEVRGIGIVKLARGQLLSRASLSLLVDLVPIDRIERLPEPAKEDLLGVRLPVLALAPFEDSAVAKLRLALMRIEAT